MDNISVFSDPATTTPDGVEQWVVGRVTEMGEVAAAVIAATVILGLGIYLVFWGLNKIKGGLG
jgi:hypothetical protein